MKILRRLLIVCVLCLLSYSGWGQVSTQARSSSLRESSLSGNLRIDLEESVKRDFLRDSTAEESSKKSGLEAAAFSMLLPGAGEYYVGDHWKAGSFLGAEVGLWVLYAVYTSKGDDQTNFFQDYADLHWSVVKYAQWMIQYGPQLNPGATDNSGIIINNDPNVPPWDRVNWNRLNAYEAQIGQKTGTYFSHQLPRRPEQQYYELIGKYPQFNPGWEDATNLNESNFHTDLTKMFLDYSKMRGQANDFYNIASTAAKLVVLNHVLSALDAAWSAGQYNKTLKMEAHLQPTMRPFGLVEFVPTARVSVGF